MSLQAQTENTEHRIQHEGPGSELLRRIYVEHLRSHMEAFYEHGSLADVVALSQALELSEQTSCTSRQAPVVEAFLEVLGIEPHKVLEFHGGRPGDGDRTRDVQLGK